MPSPRPPAGATRHRVLCTGRPGVPPAQRRRPRSVAAPGPAAALARPPAAPGRQRPPQPPDDPQADTPLLDAVLARGRAAEAAWHIPGHKRGGRAEREPAPPSLSRLLALAGPTALRHDLTELAGLDVLSSPTGPIAAAQALAAAAVGAGATRFCVNGSTGGLAAAVAAAVAAWKRRHSGGHATARRPPLILAARNCHTSVYAAAAGAGADVGWVPPPPACAAAGWPGVHHPLTPRGLRAALSAAAAAGQPPPAAVVLVSPTYFGAVADIAGLAEAARPAPLIVDEAHGPHWGAHPAFPRPAVAVGAALSVSSAHKALASLGQAALVHVARDAPPDLLQALDTALKAQQTSSPSYLLLASLDAGRAAAFEGGGRAWEPALAAVDSVRAALRCAPGVRLLADGGGGGAAWGWDPLRLTFAVDGPGGGASACCGLAVAAALEAGGGVVAEAALPGGAVVLAGGAGTGPGAAAAVVAALPGLLAARDAGRLAVGPPGPPATSAPPPFLPPAAVSPRDALYGGLAWEAVPVADAAGRVAAEALTPYPPGVPAALPGETLDPATLAHLTAVLAAGGRVTGAADASLRTVRVFLL